MSDNLSNLNGGRFLADLFQKDSLQAAFMQKVISAINKLGITLGANAVGDVTPPPPISNVNVKTSGEMMHVTLNHAAPVKRGINYFLEVDTNPNFTQPQVRPMGPSRASLPFSLPSKDDNGNLVNYYVRAFAQYPGSKPSKTTVFGGPLNPMPITMGGSTKMTLLPSAGSGTSSPTGQQGASGFGRVLTAPAVSGSVSSSIAPVTQQATPVVTPPAPLTSDNLTHGASVWETDPAYVSFRDDFTPWGGNIQLGATGVGQLGWDMHIGASWTANNPAFVGGAFPANGVLSLPTTTTANLYNCLIWPSNATVGAIYDTMSAWPLFDYPGWKLTWIFSLDSTNSFVTSFANALPNTSTYIGLCSPWATEGWQPASSGVRPPTFVGLRLDYDTTAPSIADTTFYFEAVANPNYNAAARNNTQGVTYNTGIAPLAHTWYRLDMVCTQVGQVTMTLFGGSQTVTTTLAVPKISAVSGVGGQVLAAESALGTGVVFMYTGPTSSPGQNPCFAMGSKVTISGVTGTHNTNWNSSYTLVRSNGALFFDAGGTDTTFQWTAGAEVTGYSGYVPFINFGGASVAPTGYLALQVDFFSFIWNPNLSANAPGVPNPTLARYW